MKTTQFQDSFFIELLAYVTAFKVLYVTSDGNMFRAKVDAKNRCKDLFERSKGEETMQWAKITKENCPTDNSEFTDLMARYVDEEAPKKETPVIDLEAARKEIGTRRQRRVKERDNSKKQ